MINTNKKILIIQLSAGGDVLRATSVLPYIHKKYPDSKIYFLTQTKFIPLLQNNIYIEKIVEYPRAIFRNNLLDFNIEIKKNIEELKFFFDGLENYDLCINLHNTFESALIAHISGASEIIGLAIVNSQNLYNGKIPQYFYQTIKNGILIPLNYEYILLLYFYGGLEYLKPELYFTENEIEEYKTFLFKYNIETNQSIITIQLCAGWPEKNLDITQTLKILAKIIELEKFKQSKIVFIGSERERSTAENFISKFNYENTVNLCGLITMRKSFYILKISKLLISSDSMAIHAASAFSISTVSLHYHIATIPLNENACIIKTTKETDVSDCVAAFLNHGKDAAKLFISNEIDLFFYDTKYCFKIRRYNSPLKNNFQTYFDTLYCSAYLKAHLKIDFDLAEIINEFKDYKNSIVPELNKMADIIKTCLLYLRQINLDDVNENENNIETLITIFKTLRLQKYLLYDNYIIKGKIEDLFNDTNILFSGLYNLIKNSIMYFDMET